MALAQNPSVQPGSLEALQLVRHAGVDAEQGPKRPELLSQPRWPVQVPSTLVRPQASGPGTRSQAPPHASGQTPALGTQSWRAMPFAVTAAQV